MAPDTGRSEQADASGKNGFRLTSNNTAAQANPDHSTSGFDSPWTLLMGEGQGQGLTGLEM